MTSENVETSSILQPFFKNFLNAFQKSFFRKF